MTKSMCYNKKLTIAVATFNRPKEVIRAIASCLPFDSGNVEMIIWDNHSEKCNSVIVKKYCEESIYPIKYCYSSKNLGPGGGKNAAWLLCDSEYVFIMDDDAIIGSSNFFDKIIEYMDKHREAGAAYVNIHEPSTGHNYNCRIKNCKNGVVRTLAYVGGGHIIRRNCYPKVNLYPTDFMFGSEEVYASLIIWDSGQEVHEISDLSVIHLPTASNRIVGKERDLKIIVSAYVVKKTLYPIFLAPVCDFMFILRKKKNNLDTIECEQLIKNYSKVKAEERINLKTIAMLVQLFGIINLI